MNISDVCFLCVCEVQRGAMETMEQRDAISPSHINSPGWIGGGGGPVCLCLPSERAVFLMDPQINGDGKRTTGGGNRAT